MQTVIACPQCLQLNKHGEIGQWQTNDIQSCSFQRASAPNHKPESRKLWILNISEMMKDEIKTSFHD